MRNAILYRKDSLAPQVLDRLQLVHSCLPDSDSSSVHPARRSSYITFSSAVCSRITVLYILADQLNFQCVLSVEGLCSEDSSKDLPCSRLKTHVAANTGRITDVGFV